ncbi:MAG: CHAD domain-containing protein [Bacteroidales bacterium]|nr:CHAD domain-containing protein [Bacteroidales bacterium]MBN2698932.1 CHAD domain-containing protein [Bacteroidales bacterium]
MKHDTIQIDQALPENFFRILNGQLDEISGHCVNHDEIHTSIHEIRKGFKWVRAVLRLIRDAVGYSTYYRENIFYRDLARLFSRARDYEVLLYSFKILVKRYPADLDRALSAALLQHFERLRDRYLEELMEGRDPFLTVLNELDEARKRIGYFTYRSHDFSGIRKGIGRIYRQGRKLKKTVTRNFTPVQFHNFRKRTKYLYHQIELLEKMYSPTLKGYAKSIKDLSDHLGDHRDLYQLEQYLKRHRIKGLIGQKKENILQLVHFEQAIIYDRAMKLADLVYAEKPAMFMDRMESYWNTTLNHNK